jgi:hypothetical protein
MDYRFNVGQSCGELDTGLFPAASTRTKTAPFGWINPTAYDFHLKPDSPAVDQGDANDFPATDRDGKPRANRGWAPDAGAYEVQ